jgi:hypothetical protein
MRPTVLALWLLLSATTRATAQAIVSDLTAA